MNSLSPREKSLQDRFSPYVTISPTLGRRGILIEWPSGCAIASQDGIDNEYTVRGFSIRKGAFDILKVLPSTLAGAIDSLVQPSETGQISDLLEEALARKARGLFKNLELLTNTHDRIAFLADNQRVELRQNKDQTSFTILQAPAGESPFLPKSKQVFTSRANAVTALTRLLV